MFMSAVSAESAAGGSIPVSSRWQALRLFALLSLLWCPLPLAAQWFSGSALELRSNDNVSRSPLEPYVEADLVALASVDGGVHLQTGDYTGLTLAATVTREQFRRFGGLSQTRANLQATLEHKFGLGERAPSLQLGAAIERAAFKAGQRNYWLHSVRLGYRQRLTDTLLLSAALAHENQQGDYDQLRRAVPPAPQLPGDVWNLRALVASASVEWDTGPASWLTVGLQYRDGETAASIQPYPAVLLQSTAVTFDPVFGPGVVAYRIDAQTRQLSLDWNLALSEAATAYVGIERQLTRGGRSLSYQTGIIRAGVVFSY